MAFPLVQLHVRNEIAEVLGRHVGQRMGPVFEHALVDALGLAQIRAPIAGDPGPEDMVVRTLDHIDGVDLDVAELLHRGRRRLRPLAERR